MELTNRLSERSVLDQLVEAVRTGTYLAARGAAGMAERRTGGPVLLEICRAIQALPPDAPRPGIGRRGELNAALAQREQDGLPA